MNLTSDTYNAQQSGIIYGYIFAPEKVGRAIGVDEALQWLSANPPELDNDLPEESRAFIWLHFNLSHANTEKWLNTHLNLTDNFFETLHEGTGSTRIERSQDCLIAVINDVIYDFSYEASQIASMWMSVDKRLLVTTRLHPLRSIERLRDSVKEGEQFSSTVSLFAHLLRDQADVLTQILRDATTKVDQIEDELLANRANSQVSAMREKLGALRRVFVRIRRLLALEPSVVSRLLNNPPHWFIPGYTQELSDAIEEFSVVFSDLSSLQERMKLLQEDIVGKTTEQTNRSVFVLTIVTVLALPINMVAGLLGMNVGGIPLSQSPHGFWIVATVVVGITAFIAYWVLNKHKDDGY